MNNLIEKINILANKVGYIDAMVTISEKFDIDIEDLLELISEDDILLKNIKQEFIEKKMVRNINFEKFEIKPKLI